MHCFSFLFLKYIPGWRKLFFFRVHMCRLSLIQLPCFSPVDILHPLCIHVFSYQTHLSGVLVATNVLYRVVSLIFFDKVSPRSIILFHVGFSNLIAQSVWRQFYISFFFLSIQYFNVYLFIFYLNTFCMCFCDLDVQYFFLILQIMCKIQRTITENARKRYTYVKEKPNCVAAPFVATYGTPHMPQQIISRKKCLKL